MMVNYVVELQMIFMIFIISCIFQISTTSMGYFDNIFNGGKALFHFFLLLCMFSDSFPLHCLIFNTTRSIEQLFKNSHRPKVLHSQN